MKAVMINVPPIMCEKVASGDCTILVCKTRPKIGTPFKGYIYMPKIKNDSATIRTGIEEFGNPTHRMDEKVIGEFVCDRITQFNCDRDFQEYFVAGYIGAYMPIREMCLTQKDLMNYGKGKILYGWHISNLVIYDKPKELGEFYVGKPIPTEKQTENDDCAFCKYHKWIGNLKEYVEKGIPMREKCLLKKPEPICEYTPPLKRPPQSWCYVESTK